MAEGILMFHEGRAGSRVVGKLLHQNPAVYWDGEVLKDERRPAELRAPNGTLLDPVQRLADKLRSASRRCYGFEVKPFHIENVGYEIAAFFNGIRACGYRHFIVLERKNILRKVVSSIVGAETQRWHQRADTPAKLHRIHMDLDAIRIDNFTLPLLTTLEKLAQYYVDIRAVLARDHVLHLTYEDDVQREPRAAYARICDFVGVDQVAVRVPYSRTNPFRLPQIVENFDDVRRALAGTRFEWMLEEQ